MTSRLFNSSTDRNASAALARDMIADWQASSQWLAAMRDFGPAEVRIGSNPRLPHRNIDIRFTPVSRHYAHKMAAVLLP
jgi:hypothetical protein